MADPKRQDSADDGDEFVGSNDVTRTIGSSADNPRSDGGSSGSGSTSGLANRLSEILMADGDGDLLLQQSERESNFLQWLQALDLRVMGACRADERLKPLLKVNTSSGLAEDCLLAHLSQHFDTSEVGLLARCLCVPLVSIRVGKVNKQGTLLCPTSVRGNLNLTLLPSSDLRISFVGDDGHTQRLITLNHVSECSHVAVEVIPADHSGRSFQVQLPGGETFYYWCSERSKLLGSELLSKMKDLIDKKPTLAELTGICESRLECFATHLRSYLTGSSANTQPKAAASSASRSDMRSDDGELGVNAQSLSSVRPLRSRLSPRSSSFKECLPKTLSSLKTTSREKLRRRGDLYLPTDNTFMAEAVLNLSENVKNSETASSGSSSTSPLCFLESLGKCNFPPPSATSQFSPIGSLLSPYYCLCPPCTSPIMPPIPQLTTGLTEPLSLPPLSSLLPATVPPLDLAGGPSLNLPALVSNPLVGLPFPKQSSQQFPTFTPLICDPIVHIPVLDICSSGGQGYLVSAGPAIATSIPPLHPKLVGPMMPETESMVDKGARETLRLLIGSSGNEPSATLMGVLPAVLEEDKESVVVTGSRGLYTGTNDVDAIVNSFAAVGLASLSERSLKVGSLKVCGSTGAPDALAQATGGLDLQDNASMSGEEKKDC